MNKSNSEHDHHQGRHRNLLQGLGQRPGRHVLARLAAELRRVGWPNAFPRAERLPRGRARPPRPWPIQPGFCRQRHGRLCRRSRGRDRGARSQGRDAGGPLHRRRGSRALHRPPRDEAGRQGSPDRRRAADHAEVRGQSGGPADGGVRQDAGGPHEGSLAILQGPGRPVLRRQPAGRQGLAGHLWISSGSGACRPASRTPTKASRPFPRPTSPRTSRSSTSRPWSCTARTTRSFPSRTRRRNRPGSSRARRKSTIPALRTASRPRIRIRSTPTYCPS